MEAFLIRGLSRDYKRTVYQCSSLKSSSILCAEMKVQRAYRIYALEKYLSSIRYLNRRKFVIPFVLFREIPP